MRKLKNVKKIATINTTEGDEIDMLLAQQRELYEKMSSKLPAAIKALEDKISADQSKLTMMKVILSQRQNTETAVEHKQVTTMAKAVLNPQRFREIRVEKKLTQAELARKMKYAPSTVSNAEAGNYSPGPEFIEKAAKVLDVPKDQLLN